MQLRPAQRVFIAGLFVSLFVPALTASAHREGHGRRACSDLTGEFSSAITTVNCNSPIGFCTEGQLTGDIEGIYHFEMTSMTPVPGDEAIGHFTFTGMSTITTEDGVMYGQDHGELTMSGDFPFMTIVGVFGGDGCYEHATGTITATGNLDPVTGITSGTYTATICHAQDCFRSHDDDHDHHGGGHGHGHGGH